MGGGVNLAYFFTDNVGIDVSYAVFAFESEMHTVTADLALRYPLNGPGISPYLLLGGGLRSNGSAEGLYRVGGGLDFRPMVAITWASSPMGFTTGWKAMMDSPSLDRIRFPL